MPTNHSGLPPRLARWLHAEQTGNERLIHPAFAPGEHRQPALPRRLRPEAQPVWSPTAVWLRHAEARGYGPVAAELRATLGVTCPGDRLPLLLHPQPPASHRHWVRTRGPVALPDVAASPTASYRSVLAWRTDGTAEPAVLKLSLGTLIGGSRRAFREDQIARAVLISALFDTIPAADRARLRFDWFSETAGVIENRRGHGWLLRRLPRFLAGPGRTSVLPAFSLLARAGDAPPPLVRQIREAGSHPGDFVVEHLLRPYVGALAYLLFEHGLQYEGHAQNVLYEADARGRLTGRIVLRDLADTTVNLAFRLARGRALPVFPPGFLPAGRPFPAAANAADYRCRYPGTRTFRGFLTVERYGLGGFVWPINTTLARHFPGYDSRGVERRYLELWQQATVEALGLRPLFRRSPRGLAIDEAIAHYVGQCDWRARGPTPAALPAAAEDLRITGISRRRSGRVYERVDCPWGDLYVHRGRPEFFRPAF
jgi:hypothetical protein